MTIRHRVLCSSSWLILALTAVTLAGSALAADMPKRKAGLWEISMRMEGAPNMGPMQMYRPEHRQHHAAESQGT